MLSFGHAGGGGECKSYHMVVEQPPGKTVKRMVRWFRFWCVVALKEDGEQGRVVRWGRQAVVGAWFWIWSLGWTCMACASSWCFEWRTVDWWCIRRSVANIDWGHYWSLLDCGKGEWSTQLPQGFLHKKVAFSNLGNSDGIFHIGNPHLACNCRLATKCVEICVHENVSVGRGVQCT